VEWRFRGYDGAKETLSVDIPYRVLRRDLAAKLPRLLVARHLTQQEVIDAALGRNSLLDVRAAEPGRTLTAGQNPLYVAGLFRKGME
jgi:hypothetical protein